MTAPTATPPRKNVFHTFLIIACVIWVLFIVALIGLAAMGWLSEGSDSAMVNPSEGEASQAEKTKGEDEVAVENFAINKIVKALEQVDSNLNIEVMAGSNGSFKLTQKDSGESVVINLEDLKKVAAGDTAVLEKVFAEGARGTDALSFDNSGAGRLSVGSVGGLAPLPDWFPLPTGAKVVTHLVQKQEEETTSIFLLTSTEGREVVAKFYQDKYKEAGFTVERQDTEGDGLVSTLLTAVQETPVRSVQLVFTTDHGVTQINGTYSTSK